MPPNEAQPAAANAKKGDDDAQGNAAEDAQAATGAGDDAKVPLNQDDEATKVIYFNIYVINS